MIGVTYVFPKGVGRQGSEAGGEDGALNLPIVTLLLGDSSGGLEHVSSGGR